MAEKETIILDFQVEQGDAISELEKTKKSIIQLKQEQQELNKAYKAGNVTIDEYASDQVRLEGILKKQQSQYNNVQKSVTGVKTQFDKLIDTNKGIQSSLQSTSGSLAALVPGFGQAASGVQTVTTASKALIATPLGLILGAIALAVAGVVKYFSQFAAVLDKVDDIMAGVSAVMTGLLQNLDKVASIFGDLFTGQFSSAIEKSKQLGGELANLAMEAVALEAAMRDLEDAEIDYEVAAASVENQIKRLVLQSKNRSLTEDQRIQKLKEALDLEKKLTDDLIKNREEALRIANQQAAMQLKLKRQDTETEIQFGKRILEELKKDNALQLDAERDLIVEKIKLREAAEGNSLAFQEKIANQQAALEEKAEIERANREAFAAANRRANSESVDSEDLQIKTLHEESKIALTTSFEEANLTIKKSFAAREVLNNKKKNDLILQQEIARERGMQELQNSALSFGFQIAGRNKALQSSLTLISTYLSAQKAFESQFLPVPTPDSPIRGAIAAGIAIASGLARVAQINDISFAAGGGDFKTKGPTLLMVGDNPGGVERVTVEPISGRGQTVVRGNLAKMAGGGVLETQSVTGPINAAMAFRSTLDRQPIVYASWKEATELNNRIQFKESLVTA